MAILASLNDISKTFFSSKGELKVLSKIDFEIKKNEIVALVGPSGCGKSTILNIISGLDTPSEGSIQMNGKIGYMFQKDTLLPWRNVLDNIYLGLEIRKIKTKENIDYANKLIDKYNLSNFKKHFPNELSGGMKQRVSLIRTLSLKPDLLLLDEPFSQLDAQTKLIVQEDVYSIIRKEHLSALIVTHDISEAIALSDRVVILSNRPTYIKEIIDIEDNNLSPSERRKATSFPYYFNKVFNLISYGLEPNL